MAFTLARKMKEGAPDILAKILGRTAMYAGQDFEKIEELEMFFNGFSLGLSVTNQLPKEDLTAISCFGSFMRNYLHRENQNRHWAYDLLANAGSHRRAIEKSKVLMLAFRNRLKERGIDALTEVIESANEVRIVIDHETQKYVERNES